MIHISTIYRDVLPGAEKGVNPFGIFWVGQETRCYPPPLDWDRIRVFFSEDTDTDHGWTAGFDSKISVKYVFRSDSEPGFFYRSNSDPVNLLSVWNSDFETKTAKQIWIFNILISGSLVSKSDISSRQDVFLQIYIFLSLYLSFWCRESVFKRTTYSIQPIYLCRSTYINLYQYTLTISLSFLLWLL